jgi:hypothetical protein
VTLLLVAGVLGSAWLLADLLPYVVVVALLVQLATALI